MRHPNPSQDMTSGYPHSIPTPPFSPQVNRHPPHLSEPALKSTINLLDSLVSFYQQERMWVYRTRATLEGVLQDSQLTDCSDASQLAPSTTSLHKSSTILPSPALSAPSSSEAADPVVTIKTEAPASPTGLPEPQTRWVRRKKAFKLKLDLTPKFNRRMVPPQPMPSNHHLPDEMQPGVRILEMYENMMEARMESCQRINRLIKNANRADLHLR